MRLHCRGSASESSSSARTARVATYRVTQVEHTLQTAAGERPRVRDEQTGPNSLVTDGSADDRAPRALRAGLPRVVVVREDEP